MPADTPGRPSQPAQGSNPAGELCKSARRQHERIGDKPNLVDEMKSLSIRRDENPTHKASPSSNRPSKEHFSTNASPLTTCSRVRDSSHHTATQNQSSTGSERAKTGIATSSSTARTGRPSNPRESLKKVSKGRVVKRMNTIIDTGVHPSMEEAVVEAVAMLGKKSKAPSPPARGTFAIRLIIYSYAQAWSWALVYDERAAGPSWYDDDNLVKNLFVALIPRERFEFCRGRIAVTHIDRSAALGYTEQWCFDALELLSRYGSISMNLQHLHQRALSQ
jgi:hypothetical protein